MQLREWRKREGLKLSDGAEIFDTSIGGLSQLERGHVFPHAVLISRIEGATAGEVTASDHFEAWGARSATEHANLKAQGRARWQAYQTRQKTTKR